VYENGAAQGLEYAFIRTLNNIIVEGEAKMSFSAMD
jgi:hypothetical protein